MSANRAKTAILSFCLALAAAPAFALGKGDKGSSGAQFLKIAPGARPSGMGEAFAGVADDVHAAYYNPGGLGHLKHVEVSGMHYSHFQQIDYEFAAISVPLLSWVDDPRPKNHYGVMALSIYSLSVDDIERRGLTETDEPVETFEAGDMAYALSYSYLIPDTGLSVGATAKFIDQKLDASKATAFAGDLGALFRRENLSAGAGVRHFGTKPKFNEVADPLPTTMFAGLGYRLGEGWLASGQLDLPRDNRASVAFGLEYMHRFGDKLTGSARGGFNSRHTDPGGLSGASFGAGLGYGNFGFDFAFIPFGDLGDTFKYSLIVKF